MKQATHLILITFLLFAGFSCAKKSESDPFVRCQVIFGPQDANGHRTNAFYDIDRQETVAVETCDEIWPTGLPDDNEIH